MHPEYDDSDDFELDDNEIVDKMLRKQAREELRMAVLRKKRPGSRHRRDAFDDDVDGIAGDSDEFDDYDYDEDEFDEYAR